MVNVSATYEGTLPGGEQRRALPIPSPTEEEITAQKMLVNAGIDFQRRLQCGQRASYFAELDSAGHLLALKDASNGTQAAAAETLVAMKTDNPPSR